MKKILRSTAAVLGSNAADVVSGCMLFVGSLSFIVLLFFDNGSYRRFAPPVLLIAVAGGVNLFLNGKNGTVTDDKALITAQKNKEKVQQAAQEAALLEQTRQRVFLDVLRILEEYPKGLAFGILLLRTQASEFLLGEILEEAVKKETIYRSSGVYYHPSFNSTNQ